MFVKLEKYNIKKQFFDLSMIALVEEKFHPFFYKYMEQRKKRQKHIRIFSN